MPLEDDSISQHLDGDRIELVTDDRRSILDQQAAHEVRLDILSRLSNVTRQRHHKQP